MSPAYYGFGIPHGDESAVVVIPGFLEDDFYLTHLRSWLRQIGYRPYDSGIGFNAECPNLLIKQRLVYTIKKAVSETRRKVHLIGHSLGGILARSVAVQRPDDIASVITLGSPFRGTVVHESVFRAAEGVRRNILKEHGRAVFPACFTPRCNCEFRKSLCRPMPASVNETAIYTRNDGVVDWRYCRTGDSEIDFEVPGTHVGLVFNPSVYTIIASRLAEPICRKPMRRRLRAPALPYGTIRRPVASITPTTIPAVRSCAETRSALSESGDQSAVSQEGLHSLWHSQTPSPAGKGGDEMLPMVIQRTRAFDTSIRVRNTIRYLVTAVFRALPKLRTFGFQCGLTARNPLTFSQSNCGKLLSRYDRMET
jgi:hypothetical protein